MATIIFRGHLTEDAKKVEKGITFMVAENFSNEDINYFSCFGKLTDKQLEILKKGKEVEVVGEYRTRKNTKDGKIYYNSTVYVYSVNFT